MTMELWKIMFCLFNSPWSSSTSISNHITLKMETANFFEIMLKPAHINKKFWEALMTPTFLQVFQSVWYG